MAYQSKNLSVLAYANGFTLWHYVSPDAAADILTPDYFRDAADLLRAGDLVVISAGTGAAAETRISAVTAITGGSVRMGGEPNQAAFVANPLGGNTVDAKCRAQLAAVISALVASGHMAAS